MEQREFAEGNSTGEIPPKPKTAQNLGPRDWAKAAPTRDRDLPIRSKNWGTNLANAGGSRRCAIRADESHVHTQSERGCAYGRSPERMRQDAGTAARGDGDRWRWRRRRRGGIGDWRGRDGEGERERERSLVWDKFLKFSGGGGGGCRNRGWDWWAPEMERGRRARRGVWRGGGEEVGWFAVWSTTSSTAVHEGKRWRKKKD